jgi:SAM-dependent methyltransferase
MNLAGMYSRLQHLPFDRELQEEAFGFILDRYSSTRIDTYEQALADVLEIFFAHDFVRHQYLADVALNLLRLRHAIGEDTNPSDKPSLLLALCNDKLFLGMMRRVINTDLMFEAFVQKLRRQLLLIYNSKEFLPEEYVPLAAALAEQCFNNEYIIDEDEEEKCIVEEIEKRLTRLSPAAGETGYTGVLLVFGMYRPLVLNPSVRREVMGTSPILSEPARFAFTRMIHEPLEEELLAQEIPSIGEISCLTSKAVRAQYEENPYPRWFTLGSDRLHSVQKRIKARTRESCWSAFFPPGEFEILVPGCGTGQHPLMLAAGNPDSRILAVDISKRSLAYAKRMANKLRIQNVSFLHGDLLHLTQLGQRFHHIDCVGVLHHLRDPMDGWRALHELLLPGGTIRAAVYSKASRLPVEHVRNEIRKQGIPPTADAMKKFRRNWLMQERNQRLFETLDVSFFYLSGFRDCFFHASECSYSISEIEEIIRHFNYRFLGFEAPEKLKQKYLGLFPDDPVMISFDNWKKFEQNYLASGVLLSFYLAKPTDG